MGKKFDADKHGNVPGNTIAEQVLFDEMVMRAGRGWAGLVSQMTRLCREGTRVHRITIKGLWTGGDELLIVLAADGPDGPIVAFHNANDALTLPQGLVTRLRNDTLKWREDEYAK